MLAMGFNFNVGSIVSASGIFHAGNFNNLDSATIEVMNNAVATQSTTGFGTVGTLMIGGPYSACGQRRRRHIRV